MEILDGKKLAGIRRQALKARVEAFQKTHGHPPTLAVVLVGEDPASQVYVNSKIKACHEAGLRSLETRLPSNTKEADLIDVVKELNRDPSVNGILVQLPLPASINEQNIIDSINPDKDADGLTLQNLGRLFASRQIIAPCTPQGVIELLKAYQIPMAGQNAVVVGRSEIVGKPMAHLLLQENATVTVCHSKTKNLREHLHQADIVVVAAGRARFLGGEDFRKDCVIVDVGIHRLASGKLCGDVRFEELSSLAKAATPVPGGVGPMTIAMLLENTLTLASHQAKA